MRSARIARVLAVVAGVIAIGEWIVFLPLYAMGTVNDGRLFHALVLLAFFALPIAAACAFAGASAVKQRSRLAAWILALGAALQALVEGSLAFPLFIGAAPAVSAAALAFRSRRDMATPVAEGRAGEWSQALRTGGVAALVVVGLLVLVPTVIVLLLTTVR